MQPICQKWMPRENNFEFPTFFSLILFPRAVKTIKVMIDSYLKRDIRVCFVKLDEANKLSFVRAGIIDMIGTEVLFTSVSTAVDFIEGSGQVNYSYSTYRT
mmetsp:Transcript_17798/g.22632  ORF Transcript_17798/g.22632 Transcript_17798/m.22632 type:complete len:101 (+) Transcript_17798:1852-2154(+)